MARQLETVVTYLEMHAPPERPRVEAPRTDLVLLRVPAPPVHYYRYLYNTVGEPWLWTDRRRLSDAELAAIVHDPAVELYVMHLAGAPCGYFELDRRTPPQVAGELELAYFGLMPDFIGQGLGPYLLDRAIQAAWAREPTRLWVHTQTLDHPKALPLYERAGFTAYRTETILHAAP